MAQIVVNRITNANVYLDGKSLLGKAEEINLPEFTQIMTEHKALGMVGKVELPSGIDKMEAKIKWNSFYSDVLKKAANPFEAVRLQCRTSVENYTSGGRTGQQPMTVYLTGQFKKTGLGNFKQHDNAEFESMLTITYCKVEFNGEELLEFDALANIYRVNGVDVLLNYRANIGG